MTEDTPQEKLKRMACHFNDVGSYTKANYCLEIAEYIDNLEEFQKDAFAVHPNLDLDIEWINNERR